jgi:hypothetical protein
MQPGSVYQAIKLIRQEMNLPQYNDPTLHGLDPDSVERRKKPQEEEKPEAGEDGAKPAEPHAEGETTPVASEVVAASADNTPAAVSDGKAEPASAPVPSPVVVEPTAAEAGEVAATVASNSDGVAEA